MPLVSTMIVPCSLRPVSVPSKNVKPLSIAPSNPKLSMSNPLSNKTAISLSVLFCATLTSSFFADNTLSVTTESSIITLTIAVDKLSVPVSLIVYSKVSSDPEKVDTDSYSIELSEFTVITAPFILLLIVIASKSAAVAVPKRSFDSTTIVVVPPLITVFSSATAVRLLATEPSVTVIVTSAVDASPFSSVMV